MGHSLLAPDRKYCDGREVDVVEVVVNEPSCSQTVRTALWLSLDVVKSWVERVMLHIPNRLYLGRNPEVTVSFVLSPKL